MIRSERRRLKLFMQRVGKGFYLADAKRVEQMKKENKILFSSLEKKYGGLDLVRIESCLPHKTKPKISPSFKLTTEKRIPIMVRNAKNGEKFIYIQCNRHKGNDANLVDKGFSYSKTHNCWTNDSNLI